ncbi:hypothetical protein [Pseudotenacibaculum haliotis]|uniref:Secreted protein n=1 Tax=Pseudotenacibaculum haliotis TaxID=1862138 RepID=A0ABW5LMP2_9FLAO
MKKRIAIVSVFLMLVSVGYSKSYSNTIESNEKTEQTQEDCIAPPNDRNCNGIPDDEEGISFFDILIDIIF